MKEKERQKKAEMEIQELRKKIAYLGSVFFIDEELGKGSMESIHNFSKFLSKKKSSEYARLFLNHVIKLTITNKVEYKYKLTNKKADLTEIVFLALMNTYEDKMKKCSECGSTGLYFDYDVGEAICNNCGHVHKLPLRKKPSITLKNFIK